MKYGIGYQGSKSRIAEDIIGVMPSGNRFVDLFAGGCAVAHYALLSGKYQKVLCNDLYPNGTNLFRQALDGEFNKPEYLRWVSREEFFAKKDTDDFVRLVFSFGTDGQTYMYNRTIEPLKKGFHYAIVFDDWTYLEQYAKDNNWREGLLDELKKSVEGIEICEERRMNAERCARENGLQEHNQTVLVHLLRKKRLDEINERRLNFSRAVHKNQEIGIKTSVVENLEVMNRLRNIDLAKEPEIEFTSVDYREYQHQEGDIVYCDPPYIGTKKYDGREFDHYAFYDWVRTRDFPVYFSEYNAPDDFACVWEKGISKKFAGGKSAGKRANEKLFIHEKWTR